MIVKCSSLHSLSLSTHNLLCMYSSVEHRGGGKAVSWKVSMAEEKLFHGRCGIRILELD